MKLTQVKGEIIMQKILIPYDGSKGSYKALQMGLDMKRRLGSDLTILHVLEKTEPVTPIRTEKTSSLPAAGYGIEGLNMYTPTAQERVPEENHVPYSYESETEELLNEVEAMLANAGVEAPIEVIEGDPAKTICQYEETSDIDLIIIGSSGHGGLKKLILGSVSDKVTNSAKCPVLVAK